MPSLPSDAKDHPKTTGLFNGLYSLLVRASILFHVPYTLDFLPYYLSIVNGAGGVGVFELLVFHCFV